MGVVSVPGGGRARLGGLILIINHCWLAGRSDEFRMLAFSVCGLGDRDMPVLCGAGDAQHLTSVSINKSWSWNCLTSLTSLKRPFPRRGCFRDKNVPNCDETFEYQTDSSRSGCCTRPSVPTEQRLMVSGQVMIAWSSVESALCCFFVSFVFPYHMSHS